MFTWILGLIIRVDVRKGGKTENLSALAFLFSSSDFDASGPCDAVDPVPNLQSKQTLSSVNFLRNETESQGIVGGRE